MTDLTLSIGVFGCMNVVLSVGSEAKSSDKCQGDKDPVASTRILPVSLLGA